MGKLRDFAEKLLKNIKRVEGWMHMRGNAGGKVYERGNTNKTNKANEECIILYNVRAKDKAFSV